MFGKAHCRSRPDAALAGPERIADCAFAPLRLPCRDPSSGEAIPGSSSSPTAMHASPSAVDWCRAPGSP
eukprot:9482959-Alexandrium_andersonii.AAC.1